MRHLSRRWSIPALLAAGTSPMLQAQTLVAAGHVAPVPPVASGSHDLDTQTPIKHVLVIVGENRTFDHLFATYQPKGKQTVWNLLSRGIINIDGTPGKNFAAATQFKAVDDAAAGYQPSPEGKTPYETLPAPLAGGPTTPYTTTADDAAKEETAIDASYLQYLLTGGTGLRAGAVDTRLANATTLPPGPYPLTPSMGYDAFTNSPVHRFYQMRQEMDCSVAHATHDNPSGCLADLFAWVETSIGAGSNGNPQPAGFDDKTTGEGATSLGFYNVARGDAPYLKMLADTYSLSDNFHQSIFGGTGANHIALGTGDALWFSDGHGKALTPDAINIENPNAQAGTNNFYTQDGYSGGSYSGCADTQQPGVASVTTYLNSLNVSPNCEPGHFYLLNNYNPGYLGDGTVDSGKFTIPPSSVRTIGDELLERDISWRYYGDQWNHYVADPNGLDPLDNYCNICNPFQYSTALMTNAAVRQTNLKDMTDFEQDVAKGWLPAFAILKPSGLVDGHPASSKLDLFEGFTKNIIDQVKAHPELWKDTAIFVTFDEGGGYYDSGYIQPLDYFGDGTRIPLIVVSPYSLGGHISHSYGDHVSILKFVERNWNLAPLTERSRDNLPNPVADVDNPWVPRNGPAIDDLFDMLGF